MPYYVLPVTFDAMLDDAVRHVKAMHTPYYAMTKETSFRDLVLVITSKDIEARTNHPSVWGLQCLNTLDGVLDKADILSKVVLDAFDVVSGVSHPYVLILAEVSPDACGLLRHAAMLNLAAEMMSRDDAVDTGGNEVASEAEQLENRAALLIRWAHRITQGQAATPNSKET